MGFEWVHGPDTLMKANSYVSTKLSEPVKLRNELNNEPLYNLKPLSVYTMLENSVRRVPDRVALIHKVNGQPISYTYRQFWDLCNRAAKSFIKIGLRQHTSVVIIGFNAPQWFFSLYGTIFAGGVACGTYTTNNTEACEYIIKDSSSEIVVVENKDQLAKILKCRESCNIKAIIQYSGEVLNNYNGLVKSWDEFMSLGNLVSDELLLRSIRSLAPNKCATLIYTSGTTGNPKAVMISHDNINYAAMFVIKLAQLKLDGERVISYLPLSHIAAQLIDAYISLFIGATVYFAQPDALKGSLGDTIREVKPTLFFGVPRVWEKMQEKLELMAKTQTERRLTPDQIRNLLGFGECTHMYSGAAPIKKSTILFFHRLNMVITEVFGMSESSGPHVFGLGYHNVVGSVGVSTNGYTRTKIQEPDQDGHGEICMYGRHVFMGYLNSPEKTKEAIDDNGWLHSGDIANIDQYDFVYVTGRIKELIITSGGENISPVPIEDALQAELPELISNSMLVGDHKNYLAILVALKSKQNPVTTASLDDLSDETIAWLKANGCNLTKVSEIISQKDKFCYNAIDEAIKRANKKAISRAAEVKKFTILPRDFSLATGELGPTMKLRRGIVTKMYADLIEKMYNEN